MKSIYICTNDNTAAVGERFAPLLSKMFGVPVCLNEAAADGMHCELRISPTLSPMEYSLCVEENKITVTAGGEDALIEGMADFCQRCGHRVDGAAAGLADLQIDYDPVWDSIDNLELLPPVLPDEKVTLVRAAEDEGITSPDWIQDLVLVEVHLSTACENFEKAKGLVDFYASMGVNALWFCPVYDRAGVGNGYGNIGLHTLDPIYACAKPTGENREDYRELWDNLRALVEYAHSRNVRVLLDVISWGTMYNAPILREHPDWFDGEAWGGAAFNWKNPEFCDWFVDQAAENMLCTGADGYRCDCEPNHGGYEIWGRIREKCYAAGKKILLICEDFSPKGREGVFDLEQDGVLDYRFMTRGELYQQPVAPFLPVDSTCPWEKRQKDYRFRDICDAIAKGDCIGVTPQEPEKEGRGSARFYTHCVTNHDYQHRLVRGNRLVMGYQAILAPFLPVWFCGDELGMDEDDCVIYFTPIQWDRLMENPADRYFHEDLKRYLRIRRQYRDNIAYACLDHRDTNIAPVEMTDGDGQPTMLRGYVRTNGNQRIFVLPALEDGVYTLEIECGCPTKLTDLMTEDPITELPAGKHTLTLPILKNRMRVLLAEAVTQA